MTRLDVAIGLERIPGGSALYRDYVTDGSGPVGELLGGFGPAAGDWARCLATTVRVDSGLVERLVSRNRELGVREDVLDRLGGLGDGTVRVVVTGQQPGVAGGPLMTLHKLATARALARELEARHGVRCVPLFWMGADDDDFAEIRELAVISADMALVSASLAPGATVPGRRVGDIDAAAVRDVWNAIGPLLPDGAGAPGHVAEWMSGAGDLGEAAARCIVQLTGGDVAVLDGREQLLRQCSRDLLLAFFDGEDEVRTRVADTGAALEAAGYHAQLFPAESSGLFVVEEGVRQRVPAGRRAEARERFVSDITVVSPGVIARNLMQDAVLDPVAVVLGPAEIAYRAQLAGVYSMLGVQRPVVFPRMTATYVPPPVARLLAEARVDPSLLVEDPAAVPDQLRTRLRDDTFLGAARAAQDEYGEIVRRFSEVAAGRLDVRGRDRLEKRLADVGHRLRQALDGAVEQDLYSAAARFPFLPHLRDVFARGGVAQERYLSMTVPYSFHGPAAWEGLRVLAGAFASVALDGRVEHRVYSL